MAFRLHRNAQGESPPYLLVLQHSLLDEELESRVVAPVVLAGVRQAVPHLNPMVRVEGRSCAVMVSGLAAVPKRYLGVEVTYSGIDEYDIKRCLDRLFYGI